MPFTSALHTESYYSAKAYILIKSKLLLKAYDLFQGLLPNFTSKCKSLHRSWKWA